jgi:isopenicillin N synthase-like dioxygenase
MQSVAGAINTRKNVTSQSANEALKTSDSGLPIVDASDYFAAIARGEAAALERTRLSRELHIACHEAGMFYLVGHNINHELIERALNESSKFFACSDEEKLAISMKNSPQFRGYGRLKNSRDWREQIHLGVEAGANPKFTDARYRQLEGPNQWPVSRTQQFQQAMLEYMSAIESLSACLLTFLSESLQQPSDFFTKRMNHPYLLLKTMSYLPQLNENPEIARQMGVTAHCDWSWLTFLIQDDVGGLEALDTKDVWHKVEPLKNALVVNTGELLELETGGYFRASPHRVVNERIDRQRFSLAVFVNPALDESIYPLSEATSDEFIEDSNGRASVLNEHVHKVIEPGTRPEAFLFGDSEWSRKAEGIWCYRPECILPV